MITTNTGAKKMESTDEWRQIVATSGGAHNDTVDAYDHCIGALQDSLGIVVNGKQAAVSATTGQYVILKNSTIVDSGTDMLPDGLYTAAKAISANTDIDKTYLTAVSGGGLNSLNSNLTTLDSAVSAVKNKSVTDNTSATSMGNNTNLSTNRTIRAVLSGYRKILTKTMSGTTTSAGLIDTGLATASYIIVGATINGRIPITGYESGSSKHQIALFDVSTGAISKSYAYSNLRVYYVDV